MTNYSGRMEKQKTDCQSSKKYGIVVEARQKLAGVVVIQNFI